MTIFEQEFTDNDMFKLRLYLLRWHYWREAAESGLPRHKVEYMRGLFDGTAAEIGLPGNEALSEAVDRVLAGGNDSE